MGWKRITKNRGDYFFNGIDGEEMDMLIDIPSTEPKIGKAISDLTTKRLIIIIMAHLVIVPLLSVDKFTNSS